MDVVVDMANNWTPACPAAAAFVVLLWCRAGIGTVWTLGTGHSRDRRPLRRGWAVHHGGGDSDHHVAGYYVAAAEIVADNTIDRPTVPFRRAHQARHGAAKRLSLPSIADGQLLPDGELVRS